MAHLLALTLLTLAVTVQAWSVKNICWTGQAISHFVIVHNCTDIFLKVMNFGPKNRPCFYVFCSGNSSRSTETGQLHLLEGHFLARMELSGEV